ncbi:putative baseplate assembly protein [Blastococcus sp. BMG 814]|uniref:Baseplate assembly protein n=1 Tax=Blastococcus carthaginiensis TaxID=3050034 RepID=A0ABT9I7N4_9ACTN|nr:putative baseplate assembly protein [Blastococcus carthaginiensis]MDP5181581.1 putative baseplate assembly protein [Blastococcus carthaginiensis]
MTASGPGAPVDREARRALIEGHPTLDGIDFVEVLADQRTLLVHLLNRDVPPGWDRSRVAVIGGVRVDARVNPVGLVWAWPAAVLAQASEDDLRALGAGPADAEMVRASVPEQARGGVLVVRTTTSGDFSRYVLRLLGPTGAGVPDDVDVPLAEAPFSFKVDCSTGSDCRQEAACPPIDTAAPVLDYLARDYDALRTRLLDRLSLLLPGWDDRNPADVGVMLVELFAAVGDRLAYWQDAVAVEAYLATAQQRSSVRRHARMLDYAVHEGCAARTWVALTSAAAFTLRAGAPVADLPLPGAAPGEAAEAGAVVFETCTDLAVRPARNAVPLHAWGDPDHCLPRGATSAFLAAPSATGDPELRAGDLLVLADRAAGGAVVDGDPDRRHAVRLIRDAVRREDRLAPDLTVLEVHWHPEDALPAPLRVTGRTADGRTAAPVALANVVLADHGATVEEGLSPPQVPADGPYRPVLARRGLAWADPTGLTDRPADRARGSWASASALLVPDARAARAALELDDGVRTWRPRRDLLASGRLDAHVVVEPEVDGVAHLRFGDGIAGRRPSRGSVLRARYRLGGGQGGNVVAGRLTTLLLRPDGAPAVPTGADVTVWNPLPASGGTGPERLDDVRQLAPHAFRHQLRAVVPADYAAVAARVPGVQRAVARRRWTGSWYNQEVMVDPVAGHEGAELDAAVTARLELRRRAGVDVRLAPPVYVPLQIGLRGCTAPGHSAADVAGRLSDVLSSRVLPDGRRGFFHPDAFTFGQSLYVSDVVAAAMTVPGLAWVDVTAFARRGGSDDDTQQALAAGRLDLGWREVLRCDSDPSNPEAGQVEVELRGGS